MASYPRLVDKLAKDGSQKVYVVPFSKEPARNINIFQLIWMEMEVHNTSKVITIARPIFLANTIIISPYSPLQSSGFKTLMDEHYDFGDAREWIS